MASLETLESGVAVCHMGIERSALMTKIGEKRKIYITAVPGGMRELIYDTDLAAFRQTYGRLLQTDGQPSLNRVYVLTDPKLSRGSREIAFQILEQLDKHKIPNEIIDDTTLCCWATALYICLDNYASVYNPSLY
jgi:hypothetical protein